MKTKLFIYYALIGSVLALLVYDKIQYDKDIEADRMACVLNSAEGK